MAQREKEETEVRVTESLTLCANSCGFYGNPATKNLCQSCFQAQIRSPPSGSAQKKPRSDPVSQPEADYSPPPLAAAEDWTKVAAAVAPKSTNCCSSCRKRVGLAGFRCRCGEMFCGSHRYSDRHVCSYDYKAAGREEIRRENPVVRAAKVVRI